MGNSAEKPLVLVVEDDDAIREVVGALLEDEQYPVITCENGDEALKHLNNSGIRILLTDLMMPGAIDGIGLIECFRQKRPDVGAILTSAFSKQVLSKEGSLDRIFLPKPFDISQLLAAVEQVNKGRLARKELVLS